MARLNITIDIPGWSADEVRQIISTLDEADSGPGNQVAPENVTALDVMGAIWMGDLEAMMPYEVVEGTITD